MTKQVAIFLSRKITLNRADKDPVALEPGRNVVDADVAEHAFVKAHTIEGGTTADGVELESLRARVEELTEQLAANNAPGAGGKAVEKVRAQLAEAEKARDGLRGELTASQARVVELADRVAELEKQLVAKDADMAALVESMTKPADAAKA